MRALLVLLVAPVSLSLRAQQVEVTRHDVDQGLPQSMVNHVLQDRDGFIWLGTGDGLARFDGRHFVVYKNDPRDSTSLSHNSIWGLAERDAQHLWVGTRSGLDLLDLRTGRFQHVRTGANAREEGCWEPIGQLHDVARFYSPLTARLLEVNGNAITTRRLRHSSCYTQHVEERTGTIVQVLWPDTLLTMGPNGQEHLAMLPVAQDEHINEILPWGDGWLVLTDRSAWTWSDAAGRKPLPTGTQAWMDHTSKRKRGAIAPDGRIWVGHSGVGVAVLDAQLRILQVYPLLPESERPLDITTLAFDHQGNTWVGTDGKGVFKIAPQRIKFGRCMPGQGLPWEPSSWFVRGFGQWDAHQVLVNLYQGGFAVFDERTNVLRPLELPSITRAGSMDPDRFGPVTDAHGALWLRDARSIIALEPVSGRMLLQRRSVFGNALAIGPDYDAVMISRDGLHALRHGPEGITAVPLPCVNLRSWMDSMKTIPTRMAFDGRGRLFVCQPTIPIAVWENDRRLPAGPFPSSTRFTSVQEADGGDVWMTSNEGLYLLRGADLSIERHWTVHDGLPDQFVYGMLADGAVAAWWMSTNKGLCRFDPRSGEFSGHGPSDGVQSTEFNTGAVFRSASGRLYFGGVNGYNHFLPGTLHADPDTAVTSIVGLAAQEHAIDLAALSDAPSITLPYGRNQLRIDLAVLEFTAPERNTYRYRIQGYADWTSQPAERPITLTNMPAGTYLLEVSGVNGEGLSSVPRTLLTIEVPLPFWSSPWAYVLIGSLLVAVIGGLGFARYRWLVKGRLALAEAQMKELRIRTRIAHDLHDDVGSGLAQIAALARMAERRSGKGESPGEQVAKVKDISQELMDNLRDVVWVNDPQDGDLATVLIRLKDHVRDLFEPTGVTCSFHLPDPLPERTVGNAFKRNLFLLFKEAAHNALKYSGTDRIEFRFTMDASTFSCALTDHGTGLQAGPAQGGGHGLANMRERAVEIGAQLVFLPVTTGGTTVSLSGPLTCLDH